ncbi:hypothetical protein GCM10022214_33600 [Actinomadura miaoliensis]|uniref:Uncharacterized protein n=1 Tax=Actinomadura miaoliensis TaxID=430685 RepID=A0ABP7VTK2_9ACTN
MMGKGRHESGKDTDDKSSDSQTPQGGGRGNVSTKGNSGDGKR